jgi:predicted TIM-barrel fold metal-dependent hydrolase
MECGFSWLPSLLWRFDKDWKGVWREVPWVREKPSAYVRRHIKATIEPAGLPRDDEPRDAMLDMVGAELLMYASDHPHDHGDSARALLAGLDRQTRDAIESETPASFYGIR